MAKYFTKDEEGNYSEVDGELFTQQNVDSIVKERAERVARQKFPDYDELKEKAGKVDSVKEEYETKLSEVTTKASDLEKQLGSAKLETSKVKIKHEFKLPDDADEFLTGETEDDIRKRAEKLAKTLSKGGKLDIDKEEKPKGGAESDTKKLAGKLFKRKGSDD